MTGTHALLSRQLSFASEKAEDMNFRTLSFLALLQRSDHLLDSYKPLVPRSIPHFIPLTTSETNMTATRAILILVQAIANQLATTSPNKSHSHTKYYTNQNWLLQMAPLFFVLQQPAVWILTLLEILTAFPGLTTPTTPATICPAKPMPSLLPTPFFYAGIALSVIGALIRVTCYRTLGSQFTFDLSIAENHKLIQSDLYGWVRHPSYTGSMCLISGLTLVHLTNGGWLVQCGWVQPWSIGVLAWWAIWWSYYIAVAITRGHAEDDQLRKVFKKEWEEYASRVPWWFVPGLV
ncbi:hypothetical protein JAAARDRAFT_40240 [Jaapia argillacea MUCL 33604]|uniref:Protein-S-isoprenylcysteine O-methyltransferase n=1 Tax=Jaapia argillacea MUCL 33604 TaxID=933084 RepID=A0A067PM73_9AGAM|nr:hypothetical protein JAAARDRAFT_40240 [Jaapia argillacea MUCL 33604]